MHTKQVRKGLFFHIHNKDNSMTDNITDTPKQPLWKRAIESFIVLGCSLFILVTGGMTVVLASAATAAEHGYMDKLDLLKTLFVA